MGGSSLCWEHPGLGLPGAGSTPALVGPQTSPRFAYMPRAKSCTIESLGPESGVLGISRFGVGASLCVQGWEGAGLYFITNRIHGPVLIAEVSTSERQLTQCFDRPVGRCFSWCV